jgi:hypothetical protein
VCLSTCVHIPIVSLLCPVVKKVQRCMSLPFTKACSGQIYVVLWIKYYFILEGAVQHNGFTFSNTCKKCLNMFYDFTIILKSAFVSAVFSLSAIFSSFSHFQLSDCPIHLWQKTELKSRWTVPLTDV